MIVKGGFVHVAFALIKRITIDFHGKSCALAEGLALASSAAVYTNAALASNGPVHTRPLALQGLVGKNPKPT